jgi:hypothetical protein
MADLTQKQIIGIYVNGLTAGGYTLSDYLLAFDRDVDITLKDKMFSLNIRHDRDKQLTSQNVTVPIYIDFIFCFQLNLIAEGGRAQSYINAVTDSLEEAKDILRRQNIQNFHIIGGATPIPATNVQDFLFVRVTVMAEYCHYYGV